MSTGRRSLDGWFATSSSASRSSSVRSVFPRTNSSGAMSYPEFPTHSRCSRSHRAHPTAEPITSRRGRFLPATYTAATPNLAPSTGCAAPRPKARQSPCWLTFPARRRVLIAAITFERRRSGPIRRRVRARRPPARGCGHARFGPLPRTRRAFAPGCRRALTPGDVYTRSNGRRATTAKLRFPDAWQFRSATNRTSLRVMGLLQQLAPFVVEGMNRPDLLRIPVDGPTFVGPLEQRSFEIEDVFDA